MGPTQLELLQLHVNQGQSLTLDQRVYWHEAKAMGEAYRVAEPFITNATDTLAFLARHGIHKTREDLAKWLDDNGVPK